MPQWMHDRAEHILAKNPSMPKSQAFAIATQQSHALGKSPKGFGTPEGRRTAKAKFDTPRDDKKTANPGGLKSPRLEKGAMDLSSFRAFRDEFQKIATTTGSLGAVVKKVLPTPAASNPSAAFAKARELLKQRPK